MNTFGSTAYFKLLMKIKKDFGNNDPERILMMGDQQLILKLNRNIIYGDYIFDNMFYHIYSWHAELDNIHPLCLNVLLTKKNLPSYNPMFEIMKSLIPN